MTTPLLSVVMPCYGGATVAQQTVAALSSYLPDVLASWEIVVVDDGGGDFAANPLPSAPNIRLVTHARNRGKGAAVRTGMLAATGVVRVFTDIDMPYDRELLPLMAEYILHNGFHVVIGDRRLPDSHYAPETQISRRVLSTIASTIIGSLVTGGFFDTQCGIKAVRGDIADALFRLVRTDRFAFDVEVVYLALKHGLDMKRVPVRLRRNLGSSVRPVRDAVRSAFDILRIKQRQLRGEYQSDALQSILRAEMRTAVAKFERPG